MPFTTHIPTMNDWWRLTRQYPEFRTISDRTLKDYGYMCLMEYLDQHPALQRVLEFGNGFAGNFLRRYQHSREMWALDDFHDVHYFPDKEQWENQYQTLKNSLPKVNFQRGLLGKENSTLQTRYFDVICSVSVLEEISLDEIKSVCSHAQTLLKYGGVFLNTHDLRVGDYDRLLEYIRIQKEAGFNVDAISSYNFEVNQLLLENPQAAMIYYQQAEGEERKYWGHWTTVFTVAQRGF